MRDGQRLETLKQIGSLIRDLRRRRFDLVIDIHSLYETNVLGYLSGAKTRYFSHRDRRSLQFLSNWPVRSDTEDRSSHHFDRFAAAVRPLGIDEVDRRIKIEPPHSALATARSLLDQQGAGGKRLIGLFLGAGHPTRRWPLDSFVRVASRIAADERNKVIVLLGPEERSMRQGLDAIFGDSATILEELPLSEFFAVLSLLDVLVSGDTGPMHMGAIAGAGIVLLSTAGAPDIFSPLTDRLVSINDVPFSEITPERVIDAVTGLLE